MERLRSRRGSFPQAAFFLLFSLAAAAACSATGLPGRRSVRSEATRSRPWVRLLQASSVLSALGCGLLAMHHLVFAFDGWGLRWASLLASLMACGAKLVLSALQLFIAGRGLGPSRANATAGANIAQG
ncbi:unnamed protein product, partial [Prorocentrum cordatum]